MKIFFSIALGSLIIWSVIMGFTGKKARDDKRAKLVWVSDDNPNRREQVELFNKQNKNAYVTLDPESQGKEKIVVQCLSGVGPDLFDIFDGFDLSAFMMAGIATDITDELEKRGISIEKDTWRGTHTTAILNGRAYGFPRSATADGLLFNKKLFEASGIEEPPPFIQSDTFLEIAKKLTLRDNQGRIKQFGFYFDWYQYRHFLRMWNAQIYSKDGTHCTLDSPEAISAIQFMYDLVWKHHVSPTPAEAAALPSTGGYGSGQINLFGAGQAAMAMAGRWWLPILRKNFLNLSFGVTECQFGPKRIYRAYCAVVAINRFGKHPEKALDFLLYMSSKEYNELINNQADSMGPIKKYAHSETFLKQSNFPDEAYNQVWLNILEHSSPDQVCPFVSGAAADRIINRQRDLVSNNLKSPEEAMKVAAQKINAEIQKNISRNKKLRQQYNERKENKGE